MTFEERVLAAKAKFEEAVDDLLDLVATSPSAAADVMQILNPGPPLEGVVREEHSHRHVLHYEGGETQTFDFPLPYAWGFQRRRVAHEKNDDPDVLVIKGGVNVLVALEPEDEAANERLRRKARSRPRGGTA